MSCSLAGATAEKACSSWSLQARTLAKACSVSSPLAWDRSATSRRRARMAAGDASMVYFFASTIETSGWFNAFSRGNSNPVLYVNVD